MLPCYDKFLNVGDFNIHVCCPSKPMAREFLDLIEAFNLTHVTCSMHVLGHTLDTYGFLVKNVNVIVKDAVFSDHAPVIFDLSMAVDMKCIMVGL